MATEKQSRQVERGNKQGLLRCVAHEADATERCIALGCVGRPSNECGCVGGWEQEQTSAQLTFPQHGS